MCRKRLFFLLFFICRRIGEYICLELFYFEGKARKVDPGEDKSPAAPAGARTRDLSITGESGVLTTELSPPAADVFQSTDDFRIDPRGIYNAEPIRSLPSPNPALAADCFTGTAETFQRRTVRMD